MFVYLHSKLCNLREKDWMFIVYTIDAKNEKKKV